MSDLDDTINEIVDALVDVPFKTLIHKAVAFGLRNAKVKLPNTDVIRQVTGSVYAAIRDARHTMQSAKQIAQVQELRSQLARKTKKAKRLVSSNRVFAVLTKRAPESILDEDELRVLHKINVEIK